MQTLINHKVPATPAPGRITMIKDEPTPPKREEPTRGITIDHTGVHAPDGKRIEMRTPGDKESIVETVREYDHDILDTNTKIKAGNEVLEEIIKDWDETAEVDRLTEELRVAKEKLKMKCLSTSRYNNQAETVANLREKKKDQAGILSTYIVAYFKDTGERQVLMNEATGDAKQVIVTGKLGKEEKYQMSIFPEGQA